MSGKDSIALALDNISNFSDLEKLIRETADSVGVYKVGFEQFIRFGSDILAPIREVGAKIFLDMKLHDIPNTVAKAVISASELGVDYLTLHTSGGGEMMRAAAKAASECSNPPKLIGVTVLTSTDQTTLTEDMRVVGDLAGQVEHLCSLAISSGLDGIVCSASDLPTLSADMPKGFTVITPGIRPQGADAGDQKRVATPGDAIKNGATLLVVGRPITGAKDPKAAAAAILSEIESI